MHDQYVLPTDLPVPVDDGGADHPPVKVSDPVFPPDRNAQDVIDWLEAR